MVDVVRLNNVRQWRGVECKENRTQDRPLRDAAGESDWVGGDAVDDDGLLSVGEIGKKPGVSSVCNAKGVLKAVEEDGVIDSIESSRKVK
jgi:hypothetical protein